MQTSESRTVSDRELIRGIKNGEEAALLAMMRQYRPQVFSTALRVLRFESDAQEVTQDVFWAVWRSPDRFDNGRGALLSWLVILSRSRALDLLRRIRMNAAHLDEVEQLNSGRTAEESVTRNRELLIEELLERLPPDQYWLVRKVYFEGHTFAEVASLEATPLGTVKNRARSAIRKLRMELDGRFTG